MTAAEVARATALLARRADLRTRLAAVSQATTLAGVAETLVGTGLEDQILSQSRSNVGDFISMTVAQVESDLLALGVTL